MKVYEGGRSLDGAVVTVDGCRSIRASTSIGSAAWDSSGPMKATARANSRWRCLPITSATAPRAGADGAFMRRVVAELDNAWRLTTDEIDAACAAWSPAIPDVRLADVETMRLRLCRPSLSDAPMLYRFLGDPQAMRFTHVDASLRDCRRRIAAHEWFRRRDGYAPWTSCGANPMAASSAGVACTTIRSTRRWGVEVGYHFDPAPGAKDTLRNWSRPAWTSPIDTGCPESSRSPIRATPARSASCIRPDSSRSASSRRWIGSSIGVAGAAAPNRTPVPSSRPPEPDATILPPRSGCRRSSARRPRCPRRSSASGAAVRASRPAPAQ